MTNPAILKSDRELIFYLKKREGTGSDYTFYLVRDPEDTVFEKIGADPSLDMASEKQFSFAERILIKYLILTKGDLKESNGFWDTLKNPAPNSPYKYLAKKFNESGGKNADGTLKCDLELLATTLNQIVQKENLEKEAWAKKELRGKPGFLNEFTSDETGRPWRNRLLLELAFPDLIEKPLPGRALICFSYVGRYLSVTFREINEEPGYKAPATTTRPKNLFSLSEYCHLLYREIFEKTDSTTNAHGLLVITGATKSAKSEIARGLIDLYLERKGESDRRHHLITFEDPVERFYVNENVKTCSPWVAVELPATVSRDYTPRQKKDDARLLQEALSDALRQTPAIFFVGETREPKEWEVLLEFAATGHLIVTTAHAGSLVEAMHRIFEAQNVNTSAERSEIANKLLGIIHLKRQTFQLTEDKKKPGMLFPALWRRTSRGIASLTSDGLASLLPYRPKNTKTNHSEDATSCLGRRWFTEQLITHETASQEIKAALTEGLAEDLKSKAYEKATEWDLEGV